MTEPKLLFEVIESPYVNNFRQEVQKLLNEDWRIVSSGHSTQMRIHWAHLIKREVD